MRRISFILVAFICMALAVKAQTVTELLQLDNGNTYTLRSARAFLLYSAAVPNEIAQVMEML